MPTLEELRYPIGKFTRPEIISPEQFSTYINEIERLPYDLRESVAGLTDAQLDTLTAKAVGRCGKSCIIFSIVMSIAIPV